MDFSCFSNCSFFFHFIAFGLRPSGSRFDEFFLFFDLHLLFPFYCLWFKAVGFRLWWMFFLFFDLRLLCQFYCLWFKAVGFRLSWIFFCFSNCSFFFHFIAFGLRPSGLGFDKFFFVFRLAASFSILLLWFKGVGFRLWWFFFSFSSCRFFFHFIAFGLKPSG